MTAYLAQRILPLVVVGGLMLDPLGADAEEADLTVLPQHSVLYNNLIAARLNPLGLEDQIYLGYRYRLYKDPGILWRSAYLGLAFTPTLNPALTRVGASVELKPLALLYLSVGYYFVSWFGTFEYLQSYPSPHAAHADSDQDAGKEAGDNYDTIGSELQLRAQVLGKVGPIVIRNDLNLFRGDMDLRQGEGLYYNIRIDAMVPDGGWALTNDTDVVYLSDVGLVIGLRNSVVHAFYSEGDYPPGESTDNPNTPSVRLGPLAAYMFFDRPGSRFNKPTVLLILNWYLKHRYRTGTDVSQGLPYIVLGFKLEGDLWSR